MNQTIFYSWQSDLPYDINQKAIGGAIKAAILSIEDESTHKLVYDEATRDEAGSFDIPSKILDKINSCDIFICDITTINSNDTVTRKCPNPNVLIELGFAIANIGWNRIIMVFNKQYGNFPNDLPFDLDKRRTTPFTIKDKGDKNGKTDLSNKLKKGIETIIRKNPNKPKQITSKTTDEIKKEKDLNNLKTLFSYIHIETMDYFIENLPIKIIGKIFYFWHSFQYLMDSNSFYIYNYRTKDILEKFKKLWEKSLSYDVHFSSSANGKDYNYYIPADIFPSEQSEKDFSELRKVALKLNKDFKSLMIFMRHNYIEIDFDQLSQTAIERYIETEKENL